jgi:hypothetical protein
MNNTKSEQVRCRICGQPFGLTEVLHHAPIHDECADSITALTARLAEADRLLGELLAKGLLDCPPDTHRKKCIFCGEDWLLGYEEEHAPDCPAVLVRAHLAGAAPASAATMQEKGEQHESF